MFKMIYYGIIGCGMMGNEYMCNIVLLLDVKVVVVYELDVGMCQVVQYVELDVVFVDSIEDLLVFEDLDCVLIVSLNFCYVEQLEFLVEKCILLVLVEKFLFMDLVDVVWMDMFIVNYLVLVWVVMEYCYMLLIVVFLEVV